MYSGAKRMSNDGYNSLKYKRVKLELKRLYTWILVDLPHLKPWDIAIESNFQEKHQKISFQMIMNKNSPHL